MLSNYEAELGLLREWVSKNEGLTLPEMERTLKSLPWPSGDASTWEPPYEGTRMEGPAVHCLGWKLRYMELSGALRQEKGKWYTNCGVKPALESSASSAP
jgi:hypothetical protein